MSGDSRTLTANFVADTSGFSPKINELIQRLKTLNQDFETNKARRHKYTLIQEHAYSRTQVSSLTMTNSVMRIVEESAKLLNSTLETLAAIRNEMDKQDEPQTRPRR